MKTYEKNDVKGAAKTFSISYVAYMFLALYVTDIINSVTDITMGQLTTIRAAICFVLVILLGRFLTINVVKKYQITSSYKDNLRFNINLAIIAVAVISIFYFIFSLNSNIKEVEDSSEYRFAAAVLGEDALEEELETLKKELAKMEEIEEPETVDTPIVEEKPSKIEPVEQEVKENELSPTQIEEPVVENTTEEQIPTMEEQVESFESSQEEHAIISVDELMRASESITDEEIEQYEDDGNEPISIKELEALYKSVEQEAPVVEEKVKLPEFDIKPASEVYDGKEFKNSDVISPVFGLKATEESIMLEQTANLDKLNEEIRKTNEFLSMLKELRKNLE